MDKWRSLCQINRMEMDGKTASPFDLATLRITPEILTLIARDRPHCAGEAIGAAPRRNHRKRRVINPD
jgi:hypothetical protein